MYKEFDKEHKNRWDEYSNADNQPVINVNWYEAVMFCRWIGCKLPTEAQWEYACRAGARTPFNTGDNLTTDQANYNGKFPYKSYPKGIYLEKTSDVGSYKENGFGLYDMHGNVYEWCEDWYDGNYYKECHEKGVVENPVGSETGEARVLRGGSWYDDAVYCRSANRSWFDPDYRDYDVGFRVVFLQ